MMDNTMKAVVLYERGKLDIRNMAVPKIGDDDILLEVKAAGICGGDMHFYSGAIGAWDGYPLIIGHEFAGIVAAVGKNVTAWKPGDRVVSENTGDVCGVCPACTTGNFVICLDRKVLGCHMNGGFTKYVKIPGKILKLYPACLFAIPDNLDFDEATVLEPASNTYKAVVQESGLRAGENVVVLGAGTMGLMSVQMAAILGAANIISVGLKSDKATRWPIAQKFGATHWFESDGDGSYEAKINQIAGVDGVAAVIDNVGIPGLLPAALRIVRTGGTIVRVGMNIDPLNFGINLLTEKSIILRGHMGYNTESWRACIALAKTGRLDLKSIISCHLPLEKYDEGFQRIIRKDAIKVILEP
jgi:threonine dehydrogenase-like Zn-dependent dehydrogenase